MDDNVNESIEGSLTSIELKSKVVLLSYIINIVKYYSS